MREDDRAKGEVIEKEECWRVNDNNYNAHYLGKSADMRCMKKENFTVIYPICKT